MLSGKQLNRTFDNWHIRNEFYHIHVWQKHVLTMCYKMSEETFRY